MTTQSSRQITQLLAGWGNGDRSALEKLMPLVLDELRRLAYRYMRRERASHTLQPSALINEAFIRLVDQRQAHWQNRAHFFAIAAKLMRRILVDHARSKGYAKRGANVPRVTLDESLAVAEKQAADVIVLDDALKDLESVDPRKSRIVEMRFFGGLTIEETAEALGVSSPTVEREWRAARAWLHRALSVQDHGS